MKVQIAAVLLVCCCVAFAGQKLDVQIIDRHTNQTSYSNTIPGRSSGASNATVNCRGNAYNVNCSGSSTASGSSTPPRKIAYNVLGATLSLQLPDGKVVVVNCESKYALKGDYINRRSCRIPSTNKIQAEFNGEKAKLRWPVGIDGKKFKSETYRILAVLDE